MLVDRARIFVKAGDGGSGSTSFRREKYVPKGGPDGGDGGRGGDVCLRVKPHLTSLIAFQFNQHFRAQNGKPGRGKRMNGRSGETLYVDVPPGTMVWDDETGEFIADLTEPGQIAIVARGGRGGLGNVHFATATKQAPRIAELGEPGEERTLRLELRLIADVGLVGLPNAGKSTLLAAVTRARPKIADYPFTTLEPHLGVVQVGGNDGQTFVLADVPGLIAGAAAGAGLGHEFLRHITRTKALIHLIDASGGLEARDPLNDYETIMAELRAYDAPLLNRPMVIALNKIDLPEAQANVPRLRAELERRGHPVFEISAATGKGVQELMNAVAALLREIAEHEQAMAASVQRRMYTLEEVDERQWTIEDVAPHYFRVRGKAIERLTKMTNWALEDAVERFQRVLEASGISAELEQRGIQPGDIVEIAGHELTWGEPEELGEPVRRRRTAAQRKAGIRPEDVEE